MIKFLYNQEKSMERAGDILGVSKGTFAHWMNTNKIPIGPRGNFKSRLDGINLNGKIAREVSREIGTCISNVHRYAKAHGYTLKLTRGKYRGCGRTR